jgi:integrase
MAITKRQGVRGASYRVTVDYPPDPVTGKRKQRTQTYRTKKEAELREREWLTEIDRGTALDTSKATIGKHMTAWLDTIVQHNVRPTTLAGYRATVVNHIIPRLGDAPVQRITAAKIQATYSEMLSEGKGARTVQLVHLRLQQALAVAVQWNIIAVNPCDRVKPPRARRKELRTWNRDEVRRFLVCAADDVYSPLWQIALATGMRRGELLGVRWQDIDLARGTLTVQQAVTLLNDKAIIQQPKSAASRRTVRLPSHCIAALRAHKDRHAFGATQRASGDETSDLVFTSATGGIIHPRNLIRNFALIVEEEEKRRLAERPDDTPLRRIRFHDLRHTFATLSLSGGADIKTVSTRLGHSGIAITGDVYSHVTPEMDERATAVIEEAIFGVA